VYELQTAPLTRLLAFGVTRSAARHRRVVVLVVFDRVVRYDLYSAVLHPPRREKLLRDAFELVGATA
jgi:hypothetical protein